MGIFPPQLPHAMPGMFKFCLNRTPAHYAPEKPAHYSSSRAVSCASDVMPVISDFALACVCAEHILMSWCLQGSFIHGLLGATGHCPCNISRMPLPSTNSLEVCPTLPSSLPCPTLFSALPCLAMPGHALFCSALPCPALSCPALPCLNTPYSAVPCLALPCLALPCHALPCPTLCTVLLSALHVLCTRPLDVQSSCIDVQGQYVSFAHHQ